MSSNSLQKASTDNFDQQFGVPVCGIDEVGRGPLAGSVVSACVYIPEENLDNPVWTEITDSKKISATKREKLFEPIKDLCFYGIAEATCKEIDQLNIHHATLLAMKRAYEAMNSEIPTLALIDGKFPPDLPCKTQTVIKGDGLSLSIGAASILAKVTRDREMKKLHENHPHYGWDTNAGYGTKTHMQGLETHGLTPFHRLSFAPCALIKKASGA
jgi:ribonuclease HII